MNKKELKAGDVVQINPEAHLASNGFFAGCFMLVTEPKLWGAQGFIAMPGERGTMPGHAYYRAKWEEMEPVGVAAWVPEP